MYKYKQKETDYKKPVLEEPAKQISYPDIENEKDYDLKLWKQKDYSIKHPVSKDGSIGKILTGFSETLGPYLPNPASSPPNEFWIHVLNQILQESFKKREESLKSILKLNQYPYENTGFDHNSRWIPDSNQPEEKNEDLKKTIDRSLFHENTQIQLVESILLYPENSYNENYMLLPEILEDEDIDEIWKPFQKFIDEIKKNTNWKNLDQRRTLSLLVFLSRNMKDGFFSKNHGKELNSILEKKFFTLKKKENYSSLLKNIFTHFFETKEGKIYLMECINKINKNTMGKLIWEI